MADSLDIRSLLLLTGLLTGAPLSAQSVDGEAERSYRQRYIWFDEAELVAARSHRWQQRPAACQGSQRLPLGGADFYRAIGRDDLADQYRRNAIVRWSLIGVGVGVNAAGLAAVAAGPALFAPPHRATLDGCVGCIGPLLLAVFGGSALAAVGTGLWAWGTLFDPHPVDLATTRDLIDEYNKRLLGELSLDE